MGCEDKITACSSSGIVAIDFWIKKINFARYVNKSPEYAVGQFHFHLQHYTDDVPHMRSNRKLHCRYCVTQNKHCGQKAIEHSAYATLWFRWHIVIKYQFEIKSLSLCCYEYYETVKNITFIDVLLKRLSSSREQTDRLVSNHGLTGEREPTGHRLKCSQLLPLSCPLISAFHLKSGRQNDQDQFINRILVFWARRM